MNFKDFLEADIQNTFINSDEFAESIDIDGETVNVVIDNDKLQEIKLKDKEGLHKAELLFYVSKKEMPFYPRSGQRFTFDDVSYYVTDVIDDLGMFEVSAEVARS